MKPLMLVLSFWNDGFVRAATPSSAPREALTGTTPGDCSGPQVGTRPDLAIMRRSLFFPCFLVDVNRKRRALAAAGSHEPA